MEWTVRFYMHMAGKWQARRDTENQISLGHRAYAEKQIAMWNELGRVAETTFTRINDNFIPTWHLVM